jgi:hypothetical protein
VRRRREGSVAKEAVADGGGGRRDMHSERKSQCLHIGRPKGAKAMTNPVRVEDAEVTAAAGNTLLGGRTERTLELELVDTLVGRLTVRSTFSGPKP